MDEKPFPVLDKPQVLHEMTQAFDVPAARIEATAAWSSFQNSGDPREAAKLVSDLEYELRTSPNESGMDENPYKSPAKHGSDLAGSFAGRPWLLIGFVALVLFLFLFVPLFGVHGRGLIRWFAGL